MSTLDNENLNYDNASASGILHQDDNDEPDNFQKR
jgi:hypothetical protein